MTGKIANVVPEKGFGFIVGDDGTEYFFHRSSAAGFDQLRPGAAVQFQPSMGAKGPRAEHVTAAD